MTDLFDAKLNELCKRLQEEVKLVIARDKWSTQELAMRLELLPLGVEILMQKRWTLDTAFKVASAMDLNFNVTVTKSDQ